MTHKEVLAGSYKLTFRNRISVPTSDPDMEHNSLKIWHVQDGFICVSPIRSFMQGSCKFVFPYEIGGNIAYISYFGNIEPLTYRQTRNSGNVQIIGSKTPASYRNAIMTVHKRITTAIACKEKWKDGYTRMKHTYINNAIVNESNDIKPVAIRNGIVYTLFVDFQIRRGDYRELISKIHIMDLYKYVLESKALDDVTTGITQGRTKLWVDSFGFSKEEFLNMIENCDK